MAANPDRRHGLYPAAVEGGNPRITRHYIASDAAAIGIGVLVKSDGGVVSAGASNSTLLLGVTAAFVSSAKPFVGLHPNRLKEVLVYDDPEQEFVVQTNGTPFTDERNYINAYFSLLNASTHNVTTMQGKGTVRAATRSYLAPTVATPRVVQCVGVAGLVQNNIYNQTFVELRVKIVPRFHVRVSASTLT